MKIVDVGVGGGYNVVIGRGLIDKAGELVHGVLGDRRLAVITDDKVDALYSDRLIRSLESARYETVKFVFKNGEASKNARTFIDILEFLAKNHLCRNDAVIALGGGVAGDIAGFAASAYLRGIDFVQIPTTLLAAVDSSVGGKTGIDLEAGKNLAGAFYQPKLVICDPELLKTLDHGVFCDGCAEVIKYGVIKDEKIFNMLNDPENLDIESIIARCVEIKRDVVVFDEKEQGLRQILNFGHTFGHAVEKLSNYKVSHGSAVAIGMAMIMRACVLDGKCTSGYANKLEELIKKYDLPTRTDYPAEKLYEALLSDKKRKGDHITLVVPGKEGEACLYKAELDEVKRLLIAGL